MQFYVAILKGKMIDSLSIQLLLIQLQYIAHQHYETHKNHRKCFSKKKIKKHKIIFKLRTKVSISGRAKAIGKNC